ncbi:MAG: DUF1566 domain-containing protein [Phycisphaerae bacterium]|nr:DUF1566 domain-containing protein [candidate division KSB1 bacterium]NIU99843.1 DUF1566 domain-containing protein [Phycisphaerae bacterium]NIR72016.1 DUF1566 domain-containing protein [candidate division KSB1 bacterium]NIT72246.1 DUF1566 domain-containing protein [candidate division KSB1 bacterium]NIU26055.1 DUF1566 domain-containing protein [candidate division KSB1 bacterium]
MAKKPLDDELKKAELAIKEAELEKLKEETALVRKQDPAKWYSGKSLAQITVVALTVVALYSAIDQLFLRDIKQDESRLVQMKAEVAQAALDSLNIEKKRITAMIDSLKSRVRILAAFAFGYLDSSGYAKVLKQYRMIKTNNYYDHRLNPEGTGTDNQFDLEVLGRDSVVYDAATDLTWDRGGSGRRDFDQAQRYIQVLNDREFAGFTDWHLPTLEEAMSLVEPKKNDAGLYIDPVFDKRQNEIWTADKWSASRAWVVGFYNGSCYGTHVGYNLYVRAVR